MVTRTGEVGGDWNRGGWWWLEQGRLVVTGMGRLVVIGKGEVGGNWNSEGWW